MPIKVIIDHKSLEYFIITKKLTGRQACWAKFLSGFNFIISYILGRENQKANLLTCCLNNFSLSDNNNHQQYQLQTLFSAKILKISLIIKGKNTTIIEEVIKANLKDDYYSKLRHLLETGYPVKEIDLHHFSYLSGNSKNCIC